MLLVCRSHCKEQGSPICRPGLLDIFAFFPLQWSPHLPTPVRMAVTTVLPPARPGAFTMETAPSAAPACLVMPETGTGALVSTCGRLSDPESCFGCTSPHPQGLSETFSFVWLTPLGTAGRGGKKRCPLSQRPNVIALAPDCWASMVVLGGDVPGEMGSFCQLAVSCSLELV